MKIRARPQPPATIQHNFESHREKQRRTKHGQPLNVSHAACHGTSLGHFQCSFDFTTTNKPRQSHGHAGEEPTTSLQSRHRHRFRITGVRGICYRLHNNKQSETIMRSHQRRDDYLNYCCVVVLCHHWCAWYILMTPQQQKNRGNRAVMHKKGRLSQLHVTTLLPQHWCAWNIPPTSRQ